MMRVVDEFEHYLTTEKHSSANTVSSYIRDVTQFCAWLPEGSDLRRVKPAAVSDYLTYLTDRGRSAATVIRSAASIKSFYNYLVVSDAIKANPAKGIAAAKAGVVGADVHEAGRKVIADAGYGDYFGHGFGHSLGLDIHEAPSANLRGEEPMPVGAVCSAEPGIYLPGRFGVRIEDVMILREGGCEVITKAPKELIIL